MKEPQPHQLAALALTVMQRHQDWTRSVALQHAYNLWRDAELCIEDNLKREAAEREKDKHAQDERRAKYRAAACLKCGSDNVYATNLRPWLKCANCSNSFTVDEATFDDIARRQEKVKALHSNRDFCPRCGEGSLMAYARSGSGQLIYRCSKCGADCLAKEGEDRDHLSTLKALDAQEKYFAAMQAGRGGVKP